MADVAYALAGVNFGQDDDLPKPVDILALLTGEPPEHEFIVEPLILKGKQTGLVSPRGVGKSLIGLDIGIHAAVGKATFHQPDGDPIHVIYLDMEMGRDDLWARLGDFGWSTDNPDLSTLVEHLHYFQLFKMPPLDTPQGGEVLEALVDRYQAQLVVIDTVSRVVEGGENDNDTYIALNKHTEHSLKIKEVAVLRLDHTGKDESKGSRGGSAKEDPLDIIYQMRNTGADSARLTCTKDRQNVGLPKTIDVQREYTNGVLHHVIPPEFIDEQTLDLVLLVDKLGLPDDASSRTIQKTLQGIGEGKARTLIVAAAKFRNGRKKHTVEISEPPQNHPREPGSEPLRTTPTETSDTQEEYSEDHTQNHLELSKGLVLSPKGRTTPDQTFDEPLSMIFRTLTDGR